MKLEVECAFTRPTEALAPAMPQPRPQLSAS
jgi:hypothetical protein